MLLKKCVSNIFRYAGSWVFFWHSTICEISTTPIKDTLKNLTIDDKKIVCKKNEKRSKFEALIANKLLCHDLGGGGNFAKKGGGG